MGGVGDLVVYEFCGVGLRFLREVWVVWVLSVGVGVPGRVGGSGVWGRFVHKVMFCA